MSWLKRKKRAREIFRDLSKSEDLGLLAMSTRELKDLCKEHGITYKNKIQAMAALAPVWN